MPAARRIGSRSPFGAAREAAQPGTPDAPFEMAF